MDRMKISFIFHRIKLLPIVGIKQPSIFSRAQSTRTSVLMTTHRIGSLQPYGSVSLSPPPFGYPTNLPEEPHSTDVMRNDNTHTNACINPEPNLYQTTLMNPSLKNGNHRYYIIGILYQI